MTACFALSPQAPIAKIPTSGDRTRSAHLAEWSIRRKTKSHQMKVPREAGLIRNEPKGRGRLLFLRRAKLDRRVPGLLDAP